MDARMRAIRLAEACTKLEPAEAARMLHGLLLSPRAETLALALDEQMGWVRYETRASIYAAAKAQGLEEVARMLLAAAPRAHEPGKPGPEVELVPGDRAPERRAEGARGVGALRGKPLTLGERKALARGTKRELLDRLLRDPDGDVIRVVLENPRLTERDIVTVASRRPVRHEVLRAVFASRWLARYHVKRTLVMNPYAPTDLAIRLLPALTTPDLRAVAADPALDGALRQQAAGLLALADGGRGG